MTRYAAPWGGLLIGISCLSSAVLAMVAVLVLSKGAPSALALVPLALLFAAALFTIRGYSIGAHELWVHRLWWNTRVSLGGLESVAYEPDAMQASLRVMGNGGLFAFAGTFRNRRLGNYRAYVTDRHRTVVLRFERQTLVLSPERPEAFVQELAGSAGLKGARTAQEATRGLQRGWS